MEDDEDMFEICGLSMDDFTGVVEDEDESTLEVKPLPPSKLVEKKISVYDQPPTKYSSKNISNVAPSVKYKPTMNNNLLNVKFDGNLVPEKGDHVIQKEDKEVEDEKEEQEEEDEKEEQEEEDEKEEFELNLEVVKATEKGEISKEEADKFVLDYSSDYTESSQPHFSCAKELENMDAFVIDNLLSDIECNQLIKQAEICQPGFSFWNQEDDTQNIRDFRNADTIEMTNQSISNELWKRIKIFLDNNKSNELNIDIDSIRHECDIEGIWDACGTNDNLLFSRYQKGGHFAPHTDGYNVIDINHRSMYTMLIYLNDCPADQGGTRFYSNEVKGNLIHINDNDDATSSSTSSSNKRYTANKEHELYCVEAKRGRCLIFYHNIIHEGTAPVGENGIKYIIRSDIMYKRRNPICTSEKDIEAYQLYRQAVDLAGIKGKEKDALPLFRKAFGMSRNLADVYGM